MRDFLAVAVGGAIGASARYATYLLVARWLGGGFPYATLIVNVVGSMLMGALVEVMALAWQPSGHVRIFLVVGILGAFTTFSTFSLDVASLWARGQHGLTALYVGASVILSVGAFFAGLAIVRRVLP